MNVDIEDKQDLENCSKSGLIAQIKALKSHNAQLRNIIAKTNHDKTQFSKKPPKKFDFSKCKFRHVFLKFFYLGWDYRGYVVQEDSPNTIEHHIFEALLKTCLIENRESSNYHRCGRTDKGVSSFSQVISIKLRSKSDDIEDEIDYCKTLNKVLPQNIQFVAWSNVNESMSARFDCKSRTYKYFFPRGNLNVGKMRVAANYLLGTHDFRNFCKMDVSNGVTEFIRNILFVEISNFNEKTDEFAIYVLTIQGKAFLWHQIRCIVAILLLIGQNKETPEIILDLLDVKKYPRKPDYNMASEVPLNLYECDYDNVDWIYSKEGVDLAMKRLSEMWLFMDIKSTMMKQMLIDLRDKSGTEKDFDLNECLIQGVKTKKYVPVMKRQLCTSLEDKIENFSKRCKTKL